MNTREDLERWIKEHEREFSEAADAIWEQPELGLEEYHSASVLAELLERHGFQVERGIAGMPTAFVEQWGSEGPVAGFSMEYDALPGLSQQKDKPFPAPVREGAPGHGCGHNILGTGAAMAGIALKEILEKHHIKARVKLFGTPYEEASVGKPLIGRTGAFDGVDFIIDWHPHGGNYAYYESCKSVFVLKITFRGRKSHGARPWLGRSALDGAMLFGQAIEMLREHIVPNVVEAAHTIIYTFTDCGSAYANVVPDRTVVQLYGRFCSLDISKDAFRRICRCAEGAAMATETEVKVEVVTYTHNKLPNKTLSRVVYDNLLHYGAPDFSEEEQEFVKAMQRAEGLKATGLDTEIRPYGPGQTGITDASEYSWAAPFTCVWIAMGPSGGWHNWMVTACAGNSIGKKALLRGAQVMAASALDMIENPELVRQAKEELEERLNGQSYESLLPAGHKPPVGMNAAEMDRYFPERQREMDAGIGNHKRVCREIKNGSKIEQ